MVRLSLQVDAEKKSYKWKVLDEKHPGLFIIETNKGKTTIRNPPLGRAPNIIQRSALSNCRNYLMYVKSYPYLPYLWVDERDFQVLNPVGRQWMGLKSELEGVATKAAFDIIEYDIIECVAKTIPSMCPDIIAYESERAAIEKEFQEMKLVKLPVVDDMDAFLEAHPEIKKQHALIVEAREAEGDRYCHSQELREANMASTRANLFKHILHLMAHPEEINKFLKSKEICVDDMCYLIPNS